MVYRILAEHKKRDWWAVNLNKELFADEKRLPTTFEPCNGQTEMLTIRECVQQISGLFKHTVRQPVLQNKLLHIQTGRGKRGKILVPKSALLDYLRTVA